MWDSPTRAVWLWRSPYSTSSSSHHSVCILNTWRWNINSTSVPRQTQQHQIKTQLHATDVMRTPVKITLLCWKIANAFQLLLHIPHFMWPQRMCIIRIRLLKVQRCIYIYTWGFFTHIKCLSSEKLDSRNYGTIYLYFYSLPVVWIIYFAL